LAGEAVHKIRHPLLTGRFSHVEEDHLHRCAALRAGRRNSRRRAGPEATRCCQGTERTVHRWTDLPIGREPAAGLVSDSAVLSRALGRQEMLVRAVSFEKKLRKSQPELDSKPFD
jgi:hypothetical protein